MRTSILGTFFLASEQEMQEGRVWYQQAKDISWKIADKHDVSVAAVAAVIAALSPQNPWERNVRDAENLISLYEADGKDAAIAYKCWTFNRQKLQAIKCLEDMHHETILTGQKVRAFWECIMGSTEAVVVDGHAYSIWLGERVSTSDTPKITPRLYQAIAQDYRDCTERINQITESDFIPSQVQAITWVVHRNMYGGKRRARKA